MILYIPVKFHRHSFSGSEAKVEGIEGKGGDRREGGLKGGGREGGLKQPPPSVLPSIKTPRYHRIMPFSFHIFPFSFF